MLGKYLWLLVAGLFLKLNTVFSDEDCEVTQKPKLQIVFVVDQVMKLNFANFATAHNRAMSTLLDVIKQNNFEAEYAVTGFLDYPDTAGPREITNPDLCYFLIQELTTDKAKILAALAKDIFPGAVKNHTNHDGDSEQSLTTAMLFSAVDTKLNWNKGFYDKQGNLVRKIMIPMIYKNTTRVLTTPGDRKPPKADGTDTCRNALIPEIEHLDQVLFDNQFTVVNSILKLHLYRESKVEEIYKQLFGGLFIPYYPSPVPETGKYLDGPPTWDEKPYVKSLYNIIAKEVMSCDWEDPVGYNTLGL